MLKFFKYVFLRLIGYALTYCLFATFGAMCAFIYLAASYEQNMEAPADASGKLADFFYSLEGTSESFSCGELDGGAFWIIRRSGKRDGNATVMPIFPRFFIRGGALEVSVPIAVNIASRQLDTRARFLFGEDCRLKSAYIGGAIVPKFVEAAFCGEILKYYDGAKKYLQAAKGIRSMKIAENSVVLAK